MFHIEPSFVFSRLKSIYQNLSISPHDISNNHFFDISKHVKDVYHSQFIQHILHHLRIDLLKYVENNLKQSLPSIQKNMDNIIDSMLPSEYNIQNIVNDTINMLLEEIVNEIEAYLKSNE